MFNFKAFFPDYTPVDIYDMQLELSKEYGVQPNADIRSAQFFYFYDKLIQDNKEKQKRNSIKKANNPLLR
jgi:hypothetical protein